MRTFKPKYKDKKTGKQKTVSKWWVELRDHLQIIRRFPGYTDKGQTEKLGEKIEKLVVCRMNSESPGRELSAWLEGIPNKLRDRFVKIGLLDNKRAAAGKPLANHLEDFKQSLMARGVVVRHAQQVVSRVRKTIKGCGFKYWSDISPSKIERFLADCRGKEEGIGVQTSNDYVKDFKQFCKWMVYDNRADKSPAEHLKTQKVLKGDIRRDRRALEPDEIRRLLETTKARPKRWLMTGPERAMLYRLAIETGLRRNELRSLRVSSFDFANHTVTVEDAASKNRKEGTLPLRVDTAQEIRAFVAGKMPNVPVFSRITNRTADMLRADLADAGIPYEDDAGRVCDFHALRHTTGSLLAAAGIHPKIAQSLMRHSDINLTMSRYTHIFRGQESEAIGKLPDLSLPSTQSQRARATGTEGKTDLASGLAFDGGQQRTTMDGNEQTTMDSSSKTRIGPQEAGRKTAPIRHTA